MSESRYNSKTGEWARWLLGMVAAALVSYFTVLGTLQQRLAVLETREQTRYEATRDTLARIERGIETREKAMQGIVDDWVNGIDRRTGEPLPLQRRVERQR